VANVIDTVKVGRVFFKPDSGPDLKKVTVLKLDSHVGNVVKLVEKFQRDFYSTVGGSGQETREFLIRAAQKHDEAKPDTFRVTYRGWKDNTRESLGYSFAGHRFRVSDDNRYVELLIRLHHEFSVEGIVKAQAALEAREKFSDIQVKNFPIDLYILEMCDQIEAEVETYAFTGSVQPRVFMDFHSRLCEEGRVEVKPYPFNEEEIRLSLAYYQLELCKTVPAEHSQIVKALKSGNLNQELDTLKNVIVTAPKYAECQQKEMILCEAQ